MINIVLQSEVYTRGKCKMQTVADLVEGCNLVWYKNGWIVNGKRDELPDCKILLRWGYIGKYPGKFEKELNTVEGIKFATDKQASRIILKFNNVHVPKTYFTHKEAPLPCIARPKKHSLGKHFYVVTTYKQKRMFKGRNFYFSEIYPKTHEYRVYVAGGKVLGAVNKPLIEGELRSNLSATGLSPEDWVLVNVNESVKNIAVKACEALRLDIGGVDVMVNENHDPSEVICEVNTKPFMIRQEISELFAEYFKSL